MADQIVLVVFCEMFSYFFCVLGYVIIRRTIGKRVDEWLILVSCRVFLLCLWHL